MYPHALQQTSNVFRISPTMCTLSLEYFQDSSFSLPDCCVPVAHSKELDRFVLVTDYNHHNKHVLDHSWIIAACGGICAKNRTSKSQLC